MCIETGNLTPAPFHVRNNITKLFKVFLTLDDLLDVKIYEKGSTFFETDFPTFTFFPTVKRLQR